jgi:hypothetical protein
VRRPLLALLLTLPAILGGSLLAHAAGYALAERNGALRAELLAQSGHAYLAQPALIAMVLLLVFAAGGLLCVDAELRGRPGRQVAAWPFSFVAPVGFIVQEHLERFMHEGAIPLDLFTRPEFLLGLALQLPFALLAMWIARVVLRSAKAAAATFRDRAITIRPATKPAPAPVRHYLDVVVPLSAALARCAAGRAPPLVATR